MKNVMACLVSRISTGEWEKPREKISWLPLLLRWEKYTEPARMYVAIAIENRKQLGA